MREEFYKLGMNAVIGTFFKTKKAATQFARIRSKRQRFKCVVIEFEQGYLVVCENQL